MSFWTIKNSFWSFESSHYKFIIIAIFLSRFYLLAQLVHFLSFSCPEIIDLNLDNFLLFYSQHLF